MSKQVSLMGAARIAGVDLHLARTWIDRGYIQLTGNDREATGRGRCAAAKIGPEATMRIALMAAMPRGKGRMAEAARIVREVDVLTSDVVRFSADWRCVDCHGNTSDGRRAGLWYSLHLGPMRERVLLAFA